MNDYVTNLSETDVQRYVGRILDFIENPDEEYINIINGEKFKITKENVGKYLFEIQEAYCNTWNFLIGLMNKINENKKCKDNSIDGVIDKLVIDILEIIFLKLGNGKFESEEDKKKRIEKQIIDSEDPYDDYDF